MPKLDSSIYKGFLKTLEKAMQEKYFVTLHFFRDPTIRGFITEIDKEVYVAIVESEEGNCSQIRLNQITSLMWKKNIDVDLTPKGLNQKSRKKAIRIEENEREKLEEKIPLNRKYENYIKNLKEGETKLSYDAWLIVSKEV
jgi:hypothetical protein